MNWIEFNPAINLILGFIRQKTALQYEDWAALASQAQYQVSVYFAVSCGSVYDQCVNNTYAMKRLVTRDGLDNLLLSGFIADQQYQVSELTNLNSNVLNLTDRQVLVQIHVDANPAWTMGVCLVTFAVPRHD